MTELQCNGYVAAPKNILQGNRGVPLQNQLVAILNFALKQESVNGPLMMGMLLYHKQPGCCSCAKQLAAFEKESNIEQESSVSEQQRRPDVDDDVII